MNSDQNLIETLIAEYFSMEQGVLIENHLDLITIVETDTFLGKNHPSENRKVVISRRALKHFVERRKQELMTHHNHVDSLESILFATRSLSETLECFDTYEYTPPNNYTYLKDYSHQGKPGLRIILEKVADHLEIKSIHFKKRKKKSNKKAITNDGVLV